MLLELNLKIIKLQALLVELNDDEITAAVMEDVDNYISFIGKELSRENVKVT